MLIRIKRSKHTVFIRQDFADLGEYRRVGRVLRSFVSKGVLISIGHGLYARAKKSSVTGKIIPDKFLGDLAIEALMRMGIETRPSSADEAYNSGKSLQIPTGRTIGVMGRVSRRIGFNSVFISFEDISKNVRT